MIPTYSLAKTTNLSLGQGFDLQFAPNWIRSYSIDTVGYGQVVAVITGHPDNLNSITPSPLLFFGSIRGAPVDLSTSLNSSSAGGVITRNLLINDFDGDGSQDLFLGNFGSEKTSPFPGEQNQILLQSASGFFPKAGALPVVTDSTHGPSAGDLNGDGYIDIFVNNLGDDDRNYSYILLNDGLGNFTRVADLGPGGGNYFGPVMREYSNPPFTKILDLNNDGLLDIFYPVISQFGKDLGFGYAENKGSHFELVFDEKFFWPGSSAGIFEMEAGDFNRDGRLDVVVVGTDDSDTVVRDGVSVTLGGNLVVQLYYSDGLGFGNVTNGVIDLSEVGGVGTFGGISLQVVDIDGNGAPDIEVRTFIKESFAPVRFTMFNRGDGTFDRPARNLGGIDTGHGHYLDLNNDGLLDFIYPSPNGRLSYVIASLAKPVERVGSPVADRLFGGRFGDRLDAASGDDELSGGLGNDSLSGGAGADLFIFDTTLGKKNVDRVTDFNSAEGDRIQLDSAVFARLAGLEVTASNLVVASGRSAKAVGADDYLIFDTAKGALFYDADGGGRGKAVQFATLVGVTNLAVADFEVV